MSNARSNCNISLQITPNLESQLVIISSGVAECSIKTSIKTIEGVTALQGNDYCELDSKNVSFVQLGRLDIA